MPFTGNTYDEIVLKNTRAKINFDLKRYGVDISENCELISYGSTSENAGAQP